MEVQGIEDGCLRKLSIENDNQLLYDETQEDGLSINLKYERGQQNGTQRQYRD
jgi:hypothetical protein